jgi:hypothetical protein
LPRFEDAQIRRPPSACAGRIRSDRATTHILHNESDTYAGSAVTYERFLEFGFDFHNTCVRLTKGWHDWVSGFGFDFHDSDQPRRFSVRVSEDGAGAQ